MSFVHLHNHSEYSMLDGLAKVKRMAKHAAEQGMPAIALTDHGVMHGAIEFSDACADAGVKPIIGMEAYLTKRGRRMQDRDSNFDRSPHHLLLLAMNQTGYKNLMRLATLSQLEGFYYKPRIDHAALAEFSEGIICTSGCPSAEIPRLILEGKHDLAREATQWYLNVFKDRFYFEIQEHDLPEFRQINERVIEWAREFGAPVIATNDAHYVKREDAIPHDLMLCIQTTSLYSDPKRMKFNDDSYYLRSEAEMRALFDPICPEAITNTVELAERCDVRLKDKTFHLPHFKRPARFATDADYMRYLCEIGFEVRYGIPARADGTWTHEAQPPLPEDGFVAASQRADTGKPAPQGLAVVGRPSQIVYFGEDAPIKLTALSPLALPVADAHPAMTPRRLRERLQFEIDTIVAMGFPTYMLIVWDLIRFCRERGIWWDVRGSAAGSMVSHVLMLTNIEPVSNDLYFERFLNPERVTMPDIDMDFPDDQRHLLVDYTIEKYGKDNVAQIITFGTMAARAALKDIGRVLDIPLPEVNRMTQLVPAIPGKPVTLKEALELPEIKALYESEDHLRNLYDKAMLVEGAVRNAGTHAAGVVIADKPLIEYAPLHRLTGTPITPNLNAVTQFEMNHLESIGLLKMDYLGLSMLTIIRKACELIEQRRGKRYTLNDIPIHEKVTYDVLSRGDVAGVFQVESTGMRNLMMQMKPQRFENIVAALSLYRPGPLEYIPTYIKRMHGEEGVTYHHIDLKPALEETMGILVYQEQIMRVARDFAGYSMGEADTIRKAVSKKVKEQLDKHKSKFRDGAVKKGYPSEIADKIWSDIEFFARYGFNKSHAAIYASITCQTAYLKGKYPLEYFCALLTVESGNTEKITGLIGDAKQHGIKILPPSVNASMQDFTIEDLYSAPSRSAKEGKSGDAIRFGLMAIKGVGSGPVNAIIEARNPSTGPAGRFKSLDDFCRRVDMTTMNKRALEALIKVGAFDDFGARSQLLAVVDQMIGNAVTARRAAERGQSMLFGGLDTSIETDLIVLPKNAKDIPRKQLLQEEKELIGTYVSEHPLQASLDALQEQVTHNSSQLGPAENGQKVLMAGVISFIRPHTTKAGKSMAFGEMEDLFGRIELTIFPRTWDEYQDKLVKDKIVLIAGKAEVPEGGAAKILVERVSDSFEVARNADADAAKVYYRADDRWDDIGSTGVSEDAIQAFYAMDVTPGVIPPASTSDLQSIAALDDVSFVDDGEGAPLPAEGSIEADPAFARPADDDLSAFDDASFNDDSEEEQQVNHVVQVVLVDGAPARHQPIANGASQPTTNPHPRAQDLPLIATREPLVVVMHRNGDPKSDVAKLEAVIQTLRKYEGEQPFVIALRNGGKDMNIDFPNDTTRDCAELRAELVALLGARCVQ